MHFDPREFEEEQLRILEMHDSMSSYHQHQRVARMEAAEARRDELRLMIDKKRKEMHEQREDTDREKEYSYTIVIEELSEGELARLGIRSENLPLDKFKIKADPFGNTIRLAFEARSKNPLQVKLTNLQNILLINDTVMPENNIIEKKYELMQFDKGAYFLQIIQDNKILTRKIVVE